MTVSAVVPDWGMAGLFGVFGAGAIVLYRSLFRAQDARAAAAAIPELPEKDNAQ